MNIQIFTQYYLPDTFSLSDIAKGLVEHGHSVNLLTGLPDYATGKVPKEYLFLKRRKETINGVNVRRIPIIARRKGILFRILNYFSFAFNSCIYVLFNKFNCDVIYANQTSPIFQVLPAILLKRKTGKKIITYCYDLWPESLKAWNVNESSIIFKATKKISSWIYKKCDLVAITSKPFKQYLIDICGVESDKIKYIPQHSDDLYADISGIYEANDCIDFLFAGNIGAVQDVDVIIKAAARIQSSSKFCVHIVGDGSELENMKQLSKTLNIEDRVVFHGRHPQKEMYKFYKMADCFLLTLRGRDFIGMTLPAKAQGYLCAGKPICAAIDGAGNELIKEVDCGLVVAAGDIEGLANSMQQMIENFDTYKAKGINGRKYYEQHFTKEIFMSRLTNLMKELV